jgi:hypothetical protein
MLVGGQFCLECAQSETERLLVDDDVDDVDVVKYARAMRKARTRARKANEAETGKGKSMTKRKSPRMTKTAIPKATSGRISNEVAL